MMRRSLRNSQRSRPTYVDDVSDQETAENAPEERKPTTQPTSKAKRKASGGTRPRNDALKVKDEDYEDDDADEEPKPEPKKRKVIRSTGKSNGRERDTQMHARLFGPLTSPSSLLPCAPPTRIHSITYHRPLLLQNRDGRDSLLTWFDSVSTQRSMPWRKPWINPQTVSPSDLRETLERRAYEVWISEIMLQQTRVAVVIDYWNRWMQKWPTIQSLAAAGPDDVLAAWRGLGYYSRATRIHDAAKLVCGDEAMKGLLPSSVDELVAKVPGVGRYTAGAISAIVFGVASPMVDGNVLRVLSRQMGVLGDVKTDKSVIELLWAAADALVKAVAKDACDDGVDSALERGVSDGPGRWGQALMELGSTVCTPKPDCQACPVTATCRAYAEGLLVATTKGQAPKGGNGKDSIPDIEDACNFCKPFEEVAPDDGDEDAEAAPTKKQPTRGKTKPVQRQSTLSSFFKNSSKADDESESGPAELTPEAIATIIDHARKFPVKVVKKAVKEQETLVCAIRRSDGRYLIHRRPQKGLLAGLWEFPSWIVPEDHKNTAAAYKRAAEVFASRVIDPALEAKAATHPQLKFVKRLESVPWLFSHLKLTMHVFLFELKGLDDELGTSENVTSRWSDSVEDESMGTGMRKCWELVREVNGD